MAKKRRSKRYTRKYRYPKRIVNQRPYQSSQYKAWRRAVCKRDGYCCQFPGCKVYSNRIQVHHILKWANYPAVRFEVSNGICLCRRHHKLVTGNEDQYTALFFNILRNKL